MQVKSYSSTALDTSETEQTHTTINQVVGGWLCYTIKFPMAPRKVVNMSHCLTVTNHVSHTVHYSKRVKVPITSY